MLAAASVADDFDPDLLAALTDMTAADVAAGLDETLRLGSSSSTTTATGSRTR